MAFVNEKVPPADIVNYNFITYGAKPEDCFYHWTIDRERDIYFRRVRNGREDDAPCMYCEFYWKGWLWEFDMWTEGGGGPVGRPGWRHYSKLRFSPPEELQHQRAEMIAALKEALIEYKDAGDLSQRTEFTATFDF